MLYSGVPMRSTLARLAPTRAAARFALASALVTGASACFYEDATTVQLRNPADATLLRDAPSDASVVLPEGRGPRTATVASGSFATGDVSRATYSVDAVRGADGSIVMHVDARVPLKNGDEHMLLSAGGVVEQHGHRLEEMLSPAVLQAPTLSLPRCLSLKKAYGDEGDDLGYDVDLAPACGGDPAFAMRLSAPWSSVVEIRHVRTPRRGPPLLVLGLGALFAGLGGLMVGLHNAASTNTGDGDPAVGITGYTFLAVGGALGLLSLPGLVAPTRTTVLTPGAGLPPP